MHTFQPSKIRSSYIQRTAETYSFSCAIGHVASWFLYLPLYSSANKDTPSSQHCILVTLKNLQSNWCNLRQSKLILTIVCIFGKHYLSHNGSVWYTFLMTLIAISNNIIWSCFWYMCPFLKDSFVQDNYHERWQCNFAENPTWFLLWLNQIHTEEYKKTSSLDSNWIHILQHQSKSKNPTTYPWNFCYLEISH